MKAIAAVNNEMRMTTTNPLEFLPSKSAVFTYDGTLEGFYSLVFRAFSEKTEPMEILNRRLEPQTSLDETIHVDTNPAQAQRVRDGLIKRTGERNDRLVHVAFLTQDKETDMLLWRYLHKVFNDRTGTLHQNLLDPDVYDMVQCARRVRREVHRFNGFIRFQKTSDGVFFAPVDPDNDILRLLIPHFRKRYADQEWLIYDVRRKYGIWYDKNKVHEVFIDKPAINLRTGLLSRSTMDIDEDYYRKLWQHYYDAINIIERKNHRQMKAFMPKRYWKYLPEKQVKKL
ncbi:MAG: TIGR03915 family putative DNA repair protein [Bacteroidales bacterium]|nr:TIGR03915 family putative DNA repair protein [Bacteroidales bacterium]